MATVEEELAALRAENASLRKKAAGTPTDLVFKVADKGGVSVYGLQKFPVTLYKDQWRLLMDKAPELADFIFANEDRLINKWVSPDA